MGKQFNSSSLNSNMKCVIAFVTLAIAATADMVEVMVDTAMVDTVAREKLNHTMDMEAMVDTDTVDTEVMVVTVAREKLKLPQLHTMVDTEATDMVDMEDTAMVDTVESVKLKLPQLHTTADMEVTVDTEVMVDTVMVDTVESVKLKLPHTMDMVVMVDEDTEDTLTASKRSIIYIIPRLIATLFNLESFYKIHDNMSSCYKNNLCLCQIDNKI